MEPVRPEHARRPLGRLEHALRGQPEALIFGGAALAVLTLFVCDYALPAEIRLHGLYVFPLAIAAHYCAHLWCSLAVLLLTTALQCAGYALDVVDSPAPLSELGTQFATSVLILFLARAWRTNYLAAARQAALDPLTNLGNRRAFFAQLEAQIRCQRRRGGVFSLAVLDLDGFKALNDSQGHRVGDEALKLVAEILRTRMRASDALGRIGGDEFGILMPDCGGDCAAMLRELCTSIAPPLRGGRLRGHRQHRLPDLPGCRPRTPPTPGSRPTASCTRPSSSARTAPSTPTGVRARPEPRPSASGLGGRSPRGGTPGTPRRRPRWAAVPG